MLDVASNLGKMIVGGEGGIRNSRPQQSINCTQFSGVGSYLTAVTFVMFQLIKLN